MRELNETRFSRERFTEYLRLLGYASFSDHVACKEDSITSKGLVPQNESCGNSSAADSDCISFAMFAVQDGYASRAY